MTSNSSILYASCLIQMLDCRDNNIASLTIQNIKFRNQVKKFHGFMQGEFQAYLEEIVDIFCTFSVLAAPD